MRPPAARGAPRKRREQGAAPPCRNRRRSPTAALSDTARVGRQKDEDTGIENTALGCEEGISELARSGNGEAGDPAAPGQIAEQLWQPAGVARSQPAAAAAAAAQRAAWAGEQHVVVDNAKPHMFARRQRRCFSAIFDSSLGQLLALHASAHRSA